MSHLRLVTNDDCERVERRDDERPLAELRRLVVLRPAEQPDGDGPELEPAA